MTWVAVGVDAVGLVAVYAENASAASAQKDNTKLQLEAEKQLAAQKRQWDLQDRQYRQNAVGKWAGFLDPRLVGGNSVAPATTGSGDAPGPNAPAKNLATTDSKGMPITDPNNPLFAPDPTAAPGTSVIPISRPGLFGGAPPNLMSFAAANPDYNFFNPNPDYVRRTN